MKPNQTLAHEKVVAAAAAAEQVPPLQPVT